MQFPFGKQKAFGRWYERVAGDAVGVVPVGEGCFVFALFGYERFRMLGL